MRGAATASLACSGGALSGASDGGEAATAGAGAVVDIAPVADSASLSAAFGQFLGSHCRQCRVLLCPLHAVLAT